MAKVNLLGVKKVDIEKTTDGGTVHGVKIFVTAKERGVIGLVPYSFWIDDKNKIDMVGIDLEKFVGKEIDCEIDLRGKLVYVSA
ncbi:hypothetical protein RBG61_01460 [Paludicola sp. MB14-C6]|nr:hypothetical protein [Paludicola sp. MB14-C6]WMJ23357.1 hypothetical protein RBG61_01460 [Paludicola sp. MB14-C6]